MHIGILAPPWLPVPPPRYGGTEAVVDRLARGLQAAGHQVVLWTTGDSTCPVPRRHVLARAATDRIGAVAVEVEHVLQGYAAMADADVDLIHDHTLVGPLWGPGRGHRPIITTAHGPLDGDLHRLYATIAGRVPVIAISRDQAARGAGIPVAAVVHHGLDVADVPTGDGHGDAHGPYHLFLGRMTPEKGVGEAVLAARLADQRLPNGSVPELIDHGRTGYLCWDVDDLARRMLDVAVLDRRACRAEAEARFTTARMIQDHVRCYREVLATCATAA